jgi:hypothetical protein
MMSKLIDGGRSGVLAAAVALAASSVLMVPTPASASPALPTAPASNICSFTSDRLIAHRSDGKHTVVGANGSTISGMGNVYLTLDNPTGLDTDFGSATGAIKSYHISFTVTPNYAGAKGETYEGEITSKGGVTGWIQYAKPAVSWKSDDGSVKCTSGTNGGTATVTEDVDVYSKTGGHDENKMGFLEQGTQVNLVKGGGCPSNDWCHVTGSNVPNGDGYAWGSFFSTP